MLKPAALKLPVEYAIFVINSAHVRLLQPQTRRTQIEVEVGVGQQLLFYKMVFINAMNKLKFAARLLPQTVRYPLRAQTKQFSSTPALPQKEW